jgi:hypothetical protein
METIDHVKPDNIEKPDKIMVSKETKIKCAQIPCCHKQVAIFHPPFFERRVK